MADHSNEQIVQTETIPNETIPVDFWYRIACGGACIFLCCMLQSEKGRAQLSNGFNWIRDHVEIKIR